MGWGSYFCANLFKILIGLSPICCVCIFVGPMRHSKHVVTQISSCSCIFYRCCVLLHVRCLAECPSDILVLNWTQVSPFAWAYSCLPMFNMFWSMNVCSTHFAQVMPQCQAMHTLCILQAHPMHLLVHSLALAHAQHRHTHAQLFTSCIVLLFTCFNTYNMLF